ncbi:hypothetical protein PPYR_15153 [Photinus pyralis]|uniref:SOCS box domain-containing protein n=1 Tax=Photinus pyralis TaxID=7054 RepID=A0A1Y1KQ32_PHOPY|nr:serine/threonine-protein phosphatase 6 regulatory ankyrin repeat subunit C-like [Photinus pyralis]XP_031358352.1 serine/threonine-protein phosphatase 6 regulatory ankyrin repeat subunit C-like [Photinus pyralis]KAB0790464.1 hypothetical protein PPYR_15153 [Photinus pyralis]
MELTNHCPIHDLIMRTEYTNETVTEEVVLLIQSGCDINTTDTFGMTPLHFAIARSLTCLAEQLIIRGANIDAQDKIFEGTPLHHAVKFKNHELVCMLLCYGADVNVVNRDSMTPLMYAITIGDETMASTLMDFYVHFSEVDKDGSDALLLATEKKSPIAVTLIEAGAALDSFADCDFNPFVFSLMYTDSNVFKLMWSRNYRHLLYLRSPFLLTYVKFCCFSTMEWLECLHIILSSRNAIDLMEDIDYSQLCRCLYAAFKKRAIPFEDRIIIFSLCLTLGMTLEFEDLMAIYNCFGFGDELEIAIHCGSTFTFHDVQLTCNVLLMLHILGKEPVASNTARLTLEGFVNELQLIHRDETVDHNVILNALTYFTLNDEMKSVLHELILKLGLNKFEFTIAKALDFPSLQELCRSNIRNLLRDANGVPYKFHNKIKSLMLPTALKDVLLFKRPIYNLY